MLRDGKRSCGYVTDDYWTDIGNLQQYQQANYDALAGRRASKSPGTLNRSGHLGRRELHDSIPRRGSKRRSCSDGTSSWRRAP